MKRYSTCWINRLLVLFLT